MDIKTAFFFVFAFILLFAAFRVITARNPVHAVLYLVLTFFQASAIWLLLNAEFLAITLVLVYVGAVMVLFLFVVMMLDINFEELRQGFWRHFPLAATLGALIALQMAAVLMGRGAGDEAIAMAATSGAVAPQIPNTKALGLLLYSDYVYPLQIAGVILLVAIIAAIALTLRRRKDSLAISVSEQVHVKARDRLHVIPSEQFKKEKP